MLERVHVVLGVGRRVKLPGGMFVPPQGVICERTMFVERRLACGDLVLAPTEPVPAPPTTASTKKEA